MSSKKENRSIRKRVAIPLILTLAALLVTSQAAMATVTCRGTVDGVHKWARKTSGYVGVTFHNSDTDSKRVWLLCTSNQNTGNWVTAEDCAEILDLLTVALVTGEIVAISFINSVPEDPNLSNGNGVIENCDEILTWDLLLSDHFLYLTLGQRS